MSHYLIKETMNLVSSIFNKPALPEKIRDKSDNHPVTIGQATIGLMVGLAFYTAGVHGSEIKSYVTGQNESTISNSVVAPRP